MRLLVKGGEKDSEATVALPQPRTQFPMHLVSVLAAGTLLRQNVWHISSQRREGLFSAQSLGNIVHCSREGTSSGTVVGKAHRQE